MVAGGRSEPGDAAGLRAPGRDRVMILGVGNLLLGDDGVGVHLAQWLQGEPTGLPKGTEVLDGGTFGLDLAPHLKGVTRLIIVDAAAHGSVPGHVSTWRGEDVSRVFGRPLSVHQVGVDALLGALTLMGWMPPEVTLVGVEPRDLEPSVDLSPPVAAALPAMRELVVVAATADMPGHDPARHDAGGPLQATDAPLLPIRT